MKTQDLNLRIDKLSYSYTIKEITDKEFWNNSLRTFKDANIYQTWNYAALAQNEKSVKHFAVFDRDDIISMALVRFKVIPVINCGIAYIFAGPIWQKKDGNNESDILSRIFKTLREEFVVKQRYFLRIKPFLFTDQIPNIDFVENEGFKRKTKLTPYHTLVVNLNKDLTELRRSLKDRWRKYLKRAKKNDLKVIEGNNYELYKTAISVYKEMFNRKRFKQNISTAGLGKVNLELYDEFKFKIFVIYKDENPVTATIVSAIGDTGIALLGASNELGKKYFGAYLAYWEEIKWLKEKGCSRYDLGGIDPRNNPSVYYFKSGISELEAFRVGVFEACENKLSKILVRIADFILKK